MVRAYAQAFLLRRKIENENAWILGSYVANAVTVAIANTFGKKKIDYLKKPLEIFPKTEQEEQAEIREERRKLISYLNGLRKAYKKKTGSGSDGKP